MHDVTIIKLYEITSLIRDSRGLSLLIMTGTWLGYGLWIYCVQETNEGAYIIIISEAFSVRNVNK